MERAITGFHPDSEGDWVAELSCGHNQHVRHRPPFQERPWAVDQQQRQARLGTALDCPLCERAELPEGLWRVRSTPEWDEQTMPAGLRRAHRLAPGTWARIIVIDGRLRFTMATVPPMDVELGPGTEQTIPPEVEHAVAPAGAVRLRVEFLVSDRSPPRPGGENPTPTPTPTPSPSDPVPRAEPQGAIEGGDPACWAGVLCPECGAVLGGGRHRPGCPVA